MVVLCLDSPTIINDGTLARRDVFALAQAERTWEEFAVTQPFSYTFLDSDLAAQYESERMSARLIAVAAFLTVFVACLGLLGLAAFTAERRLRRLASGKPWELLHGRY